MVTGAWPIILAGKVLCPHCLSKVRVWRTVRCEFDLVPAHLGTEAGHYGYGKAQFLGFWEDGIGDNQDYLQMICSNPECCVEWWLDEQTPENYEIPHADKRWPKELS